MRNNIKTLILNNGLTPYYMDRVMKLIKNAEIIDNTINSQIQISNTELSTIDFQDILDVIENHINSIVKDRDTDFVIRFKLTKHLNTEILNRILSFTKTYPRLVVYFEFIISNDISLLDNITDLLSYKNPGKFYYITKVILSIHNKDVWNDILDKIKEINLKHFIPIPLFNDIPDETYFTDLITLYREIIATNTAPFVMFSPFNSNIPCNAGTNEFNLNFKDNKIYATYCGCQCGYAGDSDFIDEEHPETLITYPKDLIDLFFFRLNHINDYPGYLSCPIMNIQTDYLQEIHAFINHVKLLAYNKYKY